MPRSTTAAVAPSAGWPSSDLSGGLTTTSGDANFRIDNANRNGISGGSINGDAIINVVGGDISAQGTALFEISNDDAWAVATVVEQLVRMP